MFKYMRKFHLKKWCDIGLILAIGLMSLVFTYLLAALILGIMEVNAQRDTRTSGSVTIYLISNGMHTDIVMPMHHKIYDWQKIVSPLDTRSGQPAQYIGIGWGDKGFYLENPTWEDVRVSTAVNAAAGMGGAVMHVTFFAHAPMEYADSIKIELTASEYERLVASILPSFRLDTRSHAIPIKYAHYHDSDAFYEAYGTYNLFNTCNTWVNKRLKMSGLKAVVWTPFSGSLMNVYRN